MATAAHSQIKRFRFRKDHRTPVERARLRPMLVITGLSQRFTNTRFRLDHKTLGGVDTHADHPPVLGDHLCHADRRAYRRGIYGVIKKRWLLHDDHINDFQNAIENLKYYFGSRITRRSATGYDYKQQFEYWALSPADSL